MGKILTILMTAITRFKLKIIFIVAPCIL